MGWCRVLKNPGMCFIEHEAEYGNIVPTETGRLFPVITIPKQAENSDRKPHPLTGFLSPDLHCDQTMAYFMDGKFLHRCDSRDLRGDAQGACLTGTLHGILVLDGEEKWEADCL